MDVSDYCMVDAHDAFVFEGPSCFPLNRQLITIVGFTTINLVVQRMIEKTKSDRPIYTRYLKKSP